MDADEVSTWVAVAPVTDLGPEAARVVHAAGLELALVRTPEGFFALDNACPHTGGPLDSSNVLARFKAIPSRAPCMAGSLIAQRARV